MDRLDRRMIDQLGLREEVIRWFADRPALIQYHCGPGYRWTPFQCRGSPSVCYLEHLVGSR